MNLFYLISGMFLCLPSIGYANSKTLQDLIIEAAEAGDIKGAAQTGIAGGEATIYFGAGRRTDGVPEESGVTFEFSSQEILLGLCRGSLFGQYLLSFLMLSFL